MPTELIKRVNWDLIYPPFRDLCYQLVANCQARGVDYFATDGFRSPQEQMMLWQQGRDAAGAVIDPQKVLTRLQFGMHNLGIACDFTFDSDKAKKGLQPTWKRKDYDILAEEAERLGLTAGHNFKGFPDSPHVELAVGKHSITITMLKNLNAKGGIRSAWALLDTIDWSAAG